MLELNRRFLNHDYYTDTLTFAHSTNPKYATGEIYISLQRIKENSKAFSTSCENELIRVIVHGCLHLCGYNDKTEIQSCKMLQKQEEYLNSWDVSRET